MASRQAPGCPTAPRGQLFALSQRFQHRVTWRSITTKGGDMKSRVCVFCDEEIGRDAPPEHVLPQWLRRLRPKRGRFIEARAVTITGEPPNSIPKQPTARSKTPTITTNLVCRDCNGRWMSDLETRASPLLRPMIVGQPRPLSVEEQAFVAVWGIKTGMTWQVSPTSVRATPLADYRYLRIHKTPPPHTRVRLGRYLGAAFQAFADHNLAHLGSSAPGRVNLEDDPEGHWAILRIGQLVFEIFGSSRGGLPRVHDPALSGHSMIDIWPSVKGRYWPPPQSFDDAAFFALMQIDPAQLPAPPWTTSS